MIYRNKGHEGQLDLLNKTGNYLESFGGRSIYILYETFIISLSLSLSHRLINNKKRKKIKKNPRE